MKNKMSMMMMMKQKKKKREKKNERRNNFNILKVHYKQYYFHSQFVILQFVRFN